MKPVNLFVFLFIVVISDGFAQVEGSTAYTYRENNNHVMELQAGHGDSKTPGKVKIEFYGHMAFKITSPMGVTIMIDPWRNDPTGNFGVWYPEKFPPVKVDIVMSSHAHFDHDAIYAPHATMNLDRLAGEFKLADVKIVGVADKHQCHPPGEIKWDDYLKNTFNITNLCPPNNDGSWDNVIYVIETGAMRIGFWGDNRPDPGPQAAKILAGLDLLIICIDESEHILSYSQVKSILDRFKPKAIIPAHYLSKGIVLPASTLKPADQWVSSQRDVVKLASAELTVDKKMLTGAIKRVYYFGNNYKTE